MGRHSRNAWTGLAFSKFSSVFSVPSVVKGFTDFPGQYGKSFNTEGTEKTGVMDELAGRYWTRNPARESMSGYGSRPS